MASQAGDPRSTQAYKKIRAALRKQRLPCAICGAQINYRANSRRDPDSFVVDHILEVKNGGTNSRENCRPSHRACNQARNRKRQAAAEDAANLKRRLMFERKSRIW